jgi:hypothetical protein
MWMSADTTPSNAATFTSQTSFYEYPTHVPFINNVQHPLRSTMTVSTSAALPESNRDRLLTALQSLSFRIKHLESQRQVSRSMCVEPMATTSTIACLEQHAGGRSESTRDHGRTEPNEPRRFARSCHRWDERRTRTLSPARRRRRQARVRRRSTSVGHNSAGPSTETFARLRPK